MPLKIYAAFLLYVTILRLRGEIVQWETVCVKPEEPER